MQDLSRKCEWTIRTKHSPQQYTVIASNEQLRIVMNILCNQSPIEYFERDQIWEIIHWGKDKWVRLTSGEVDWGKIVFLNLSTSEVESGAYTRKEDAQLNPG